MLENHKLVLRFFFYRKSLLLQKETLAMYYDVIYSFDQIFTDILLFFGQFNVYNTITTTTKKCVTIKQKHANIFKLFFHQ